MLNHSKALMLVLGLVSWGSVTAGSLTGVHPVMSDRFQISVGGYFANEDGSVGFGDRDLGIGIGVDLDDLGLGGTSTSPFASGLWRITDRFLVFGEYYQLDTKGKSSLSGPLDIFKVTVRADTELDLARIFVGYSFLKDSNREIGAGIGVHYLRSALSASADLSLIGEPIIGGAEGYDESGILPDVGAYANYAFSDKWLIGGRVNWLGADIDDSSGELWNIEATVTYQAFENVGVSLGYRYMDYEVEASDKNGDWDVSMEFSGPLLSINIGF